jgi:monoamine oxidase
MCPRPARGLVPCSLRRCPLGRNDNRTQRPPLADSVWRADPFARGSYSCARPGHADRLFFTGEACSPNFFSTAHGAYETGLDAADAALATLRR